MTLETQRVHLSRCIASSMAILSLALFVLGANAVSADCDPPQGPISQPYSGEEFHAEQAQGIVDLWASIVDPSDSFYIQPMQDVFSVDGCEAVCERKARKKETEAYAELWLALDL